MEFLRMLEAARTPLLNAILSAVTYLGDEVCFMALALVIFWCVSKRTAYYVFFVGFAGTVANQWLKLLFRIPRPWVIDPSFTIVESARAAATGYSFPSGHTQNIVGTLGSIALSVKKIWVRVVCAVLILAVPFSRMYLGVHTPLDVGVAFGCAVLLVLVLYPCFRDDARWTRSMPALFVLLAALVLAYLAFVLLYRFPAEIDAENLAHGVKNAWTLTGCMLGLLVAYVFDRKKLHFDVKAPLLGQVLKLALGLALLIGVRAGLKPVLNLVFRGHQAANMVRYFCVVVFAGCLWPMTFPFFAKLGAKKR